MLRNLAPPARERSALPFRPALSGPQGPAFQACPFKLSGPQGPAFQACPFRASGPCLSGLPFQGNNGQAAERRFANPACDLASTQGRRRFGGGSWAGPGAESESLDSIDAVEDEDDDDELLDDAVVEDELSADDGDGWLK